MVTGSPGVGKTTFARLAAKFLRAYGVLGEDTFVEKNGLELKGDGGGDKGKEDAGVVGETRDVPCSLVACYPCMCAGCHALRTRAAPCAHRLATEAPHARSHGQWRQCAAAPVLSTAVLCASHTQHCQRVTQDSMPTGRKSAKEAAG